MKNKWAIIFSFIIVVTVIIILFTPRIGHRWSEDCWVASPDANTISGVLSTGITYEFRGEINLNEFRRQCHLYLEASSDETVIGETPTEIVEAIQHYIFPHLQNSEEAFRYRGGERTTIIIYYCSETDNWVVGRASAHHRRVVLGLIQDSAFVINRSTGDMVLFSTLSYAPRIVELWDGWRRTLWSLNFYLTVTVFLR